MKRHVLAALSMLVVLASQSCASPQSQGEALRLPALFGDGMVLQRGAEVPVCGWAEPGVDVTVQLDRIRFSTQADAAGTWHLRIGPFEATGKPLRMIVTAGKVTKIYQDILIGDVWLCSGQSNMEWPVHMSQDAPQEIADANHPKIRLFKVPHAAKPEPLEDIAPDESDGRWRACTPESVKSFSAVGYFFGRKTHADLDGVPIGLIQSTWGGTTAEAWTSWPALTGQPAAKSILERFARRRAQFASQTKTYPEKITHWKDEKARAKAEGRPYDSPEPRRPADPRYSSSGPASLYNGMIAPLIPYAIKGAIWYQGESNARRSEQYRQLFPGLIRDWRGAWAQGDFPFLFVQLANYRAVAESPGPSHWAELREAQTMTLALPKTGMAVAIDVGEAKDIHPKDKQTVGHRLALSAQAIAYGEKIVYSGPIYKSMTREGNKIRLRFEQTGSGLTVGTEKELKGFEIAGKDRKFVWASAQIDGPAVLVWSKEVPGPVAVRYAWADNPVCNLYNKEGLPASPFRTDIWPRSMALVKSGRLWTARFLTVLTTVIFLAYLSPTPGTSTVMESTTCLSGRIWLTQMAMKRAARPIWCTARAEPRRYPGRLIWPIPM